MLSQSTVEALNVPQQLSAVRLVANTNQTGTYYNGPTNNGVRATFTYAAGALTIDSVAVNLNDYILFSDQTLGYENGIWQVVVLGSASVGAVLQRRGDFQCIEQIRTGSYVPVQAGTTYGGSIWTLVEPRPAAVGVPVVSGANNIVFAVTTATTSGAFLLAANNLSDVASPTTSLGNLGVHSAKFTNAGGSATTTITDAKITAASVVVGNWQSQANAAEVEHITPGAGSMTVVSTADPGASVFAYIATSAAE